MVFGGIHEDFPSQGGWSKCISPDESVHAPSVTPLARTTVAFKRDLFPLRPFSVAVPDDLNRDHRMKDVASGCAETEGACTASIDSIAGSATLAML